MTNEENPVVPVFIPVLGVLLLSIEKQKGSPLTEEEVADARNRAVCMMMPLSVKQEMEEKRGYRDIDPQNVWPEWLAFRAEAASAAP